MASNRAARIDGELVRCLGEIFLKDIKDPRMSRMANVTRVHATPDLKYAKVYVSVYDDAEKVEGTFEALRSAEPFIRSRVNSMVKLRRIPTFEFVHDDSIEYSAHISKVIDSLNIVKDEDTDE